MLWMRLAFVSALVLSASTAGAVDVSTCGQVIQRGEVGVLIADLACSETGVELESGATLQLDGHTLAVSSGAGIECEAGRCAVEGPGVIDGQSTGDAGIYLYGKVRLSLRDVVIRDLDNGVLGLSRNRVDFENVLIDGIGIMGIDLGDRSRLKGSGLTVQNTVGPLGRAVHATKCMGENWTITDNQAIFALRQSGLACGSARLSGLVATNNAGIGVWLGASGRFFDSTITGNDAAADGIDLMSDGRPRLFGGTCGRSSNHDGTPWGVCTGD
jgi:hypothetical protein